MKPRKRGQLVREFILRHVADHPNDIARQTTDHFHISRQAVNKHLKALVSERVLTEAGQTRSRIYELARLRQWAKDYSTSHALAEDVVWTDDVQPLLSRLPENALDIWRYGFTEMFNNAIDHSGGTSITVSLTETAVDNTILLVDNGVGIFKKIQKALHLLDERHSVLELAKGKLTTDPKHHTGEGIFFTSRMFDYFAILSGGVFFSHQVKRTEDWLSENEQPLAGTWILMRLANQTTRRREKIYDEFAPEEADYQFSKTVVPVTLARYGDDELISRSQAKRLLARIDRFKNVILDFKGVPRIGQAFADEIFRVFAHDHPDIQLRFINTSSEVKRMIGRALGAKP